MIPSEWPSLKAPGLGQSQRFILDALKRLGQATIPQLASESQLNIETVRNHLKALAGHGLVRREGSRKSGPGRPEVIYGLTPEAETLFPRQEGELLRELAAHLVKTGHQKVLRNFLEHRIASRREEALARVQPLAGRKRLEEVARIFSELGFMAVVEKTGGQPQLRLCHCPIRELVRSTGLPCAVEIGFMQELVGNRLTRVSHIPAGAASCSYQKEPGC